VIQHGSWLCLVHCSEIMGRRWGSVMPTRIAREGVSIMPRFWRDVIRQCFNGLDPQCETCLSGSPVPHFPFMIDHRLHCTCDHCF
jgi:hypothetical protein